MLSKYQSLAGVVSITWQFDGLVVRGLVQFYACVYVHECLRSV